MDVYIRVLFIDFYVFNVNIRFLICLKVVFEILEYGFIVMIINLYLFNIFLDVLIWDYIVLVC